MVKRPRILFFPFRIWQTFCILGQTHLRGLHGDASQLSTVYSTQGYSGESGQEKTVSFVSFMYLGTPFFRGRSSKWTEQSDRWWRILPRQNFHTIGIGDHLYFLNEKLKQIANETNLFEGLNWSNYTQWWRRCCRTITLLQLDPNHCLKSLEINTLFVHNRLGKGFQFCVLLF